MQLSRHRIKELSKSSTIKMLFKNAIGICSIYIMYVCMDCTYHYRVSCTRNFVLVDMKLCLSG